MIEKGKLKRVANSFCVQVSASEFVSNPVRSLFSSFIASENESFSITHNNASAAAFDSFSSEWKDLSLNDLSMTMVADDDDVPKVNRTHSTHQNETTFQKA